MACDVMIDINNISKCFKIYDKPQDRLKQSLYRGRKQFYREFWALNNISLQVMKGETVGIIGRNGSGKSTLLQIIAGTLNPTDGQVRVNGKVAALLELGSGFNPEFTGRENVYMNGAILGLNKEQIDKLFPEIVDFADIGNFIDQPVKVYSSGMAIRLAFAVQAMIPKEVLIVDEALAVGDELFQRKCYAKIEEFKKQGGTILLVSHSGSSIVELCDRAVLMDSGEVLLTDSSRRVVNLYQKLIYAPFDKKEELRKEIKETVIDVMNVSDDKTLNNIKENKEAKTLKYEAMFDPNFIPKEVIQYESRGARIYNPEIVTLGGKSVNMLLAGEKYIWRYYIKFTETCQNIRFGMLIKTSSGLELGGSVSAPLGQGIPAANPGDIFKVEFSFVPRLNAGTYFLNAGVSGLSDEGEIFLDRRIDLAAFKILHKEDSLVTLFVDFGVTPEIIRDETNNIEVGGVPQ